MPSQPVPLRVYDSRAMDEKGGSGERGESASGASPARSTHSVPRPSPYGYARDGSAVVVCAYVFKCLAIVPYYQILRAACTCYDYRHNVVVAATGSAGYSIYNTHVVFVPKRTTMYTQHPTSPTPHRVPRHTRTGGGSGPAGPRGLLSVRRRRVPSAESELLRAVSAPAS